MSARPALTLALLLGLGGSAAAHEHEPTAEAGDAKDDAHAEMRLFDEGIAAISSGDFQLNVHGRVQAWGGWVGDDALLSNADEMQEPGFRLRRVRLGVDGTLMRDVGYEIELDLFDLERSGGALYQALIDWTPTPLFGVSAGVQRMPFMKSQMMSSAYLPHLDRPLGSDAMSPVNGMGVVLHSKPWADKLCIHAGVFNALRRRTTFLEGYEEVGVTLGNRFEGLAYAGRLTFAPFGKMGKGLADLGGLKHEMFKVAVGGGGFYNDGGSIDTWGVTADLHLKAYGFHLFVEYAQEHAEPETRPTTTDTIVAEIDRRTLGASLGFVFLPGLMGVAGRFELIDDNLDQETVGDEWIAAATLNFYGLGEHLKAQIEYAHREEMHGNSLANDWVIAGVQLFF